MQSKVRVNLVRPPQPVQPIVDLTALAYDLAAFALQPAPGDGLPKRLSDGRPGHTEPSRDFRPGQPRL